MSFGLIDLFLIPFLMRVPWHDWVFGFRLPSPALRTDFISSHNIDNDPIDTPLFAQIPSNTAVYQTQDSWLTSTPSSPPSRPPNNRNRIRFIAPRLVAERPPPELVSAAFMCVFCRFPPPSAHPPLPRRNPPPEQQQQRQRQPQTMTMTPSHPNVANALLRLPPPLPPL